MPDTRHRILDPGQGDHEPRPRSNHRKTTPRNQTARKILITSQVGPRASAFKLVPLYSGLPLKSQISNLKSHRARLIPPAVFAETCVGPPVTLFFRSSS